MSDENPMPEFGREIRIMKRRTKADWASTLTAPAGVAIRDTREFIAGIVEMTEGCADIDKRSIIKPGVTIRREAKRILALLDKHSLND